MNDITLVMFVDDNTYGVVKKGDVFTQDADEQVEIEKEYDIKWGRDKFRGIVKYIGTQEGANTQLKRITNYVIKEKSPKKNKKHEKNISTLPSASNKKANLILNACTQKSNVTSEKNEDQTLTRKLKEREDLINKLRHDLGEQEKIIAQKTGEVETMKEILGNNNTLIKINEKNKKFT